MPELQRGGEEGEGGEGRRRGNPGGQGVLLPGVLVGAP